MAYPVDIEVTEKCLRLISTISNDVNAMKNVRDNQNNMQHRLEDEDMYQEEAERVRSGYYLSTKELFEILQTRYDGPKNPFADLANSEYLDEPFDSTQTHINQTDNSMFENNWNFIVDSFETNAEVEESIMSSFDKSSLLKLSSMKPQEIDRLINAEDTINQSTTTTTTTTADYLRCNEVLPNSSSSTSETTELEMLAARTLCGLSVDENEVLLRLKCEKQFADCVFIENGSLVYPIVTNSNFDHLGYDTKAEIVNNSIIANEIFNDQSKTATTSANIRDNMNQQETNANKPYDGNNSLPLAIFENKSLEELKTILNKNKSRRSII